MTFAEFRCAERARLTVADESRETVTIEVRAAACATLPFTLIAFDRGGDELDLLGVGQDVDEHVWLLDESGTARFSMSAKDAVRVAGVELTIDTWSVPSFWAPPSDLT